ncbi:hypothetical protein PIB30_098385, partial [Stylosanthes scabra]|nr:hypothetical protein [Stylosanthes scabra]
SYAMDQRQPLVIRLQPNAVAHERQDGVWFQSDSPVVFQHAEISTMVELHAVFLYHLGGGFTGIRKVGVPLPAAATRRKVPASACWPYPGWAAGCGDTGPDS